MFSTSEFTSSEGVIVAKGKRGFASMDPVKQREIASKGGKAAHQKGTAHEWTGDEAKEAGRKGGAASHRNAHRTSPELEGSMNEPELPEPNPTLP